MSRRASIMVVMMLLCLGASTGGAEPDAKIADSNPFERIEYDADGTAKTLQTSLVRYTATAESKHAGATVDLIAVYHIGEIDYYRELNVRCGSYESLIYEQIRGSDDRPLIGLPKHQGLAEQLDLIHQYDGIDISRSNFVNGDLTQEELIKKWVASGRSPASLAAYGDQMSDDDELAVKKALLSPNGANMARQYYAKKFVSESRTEDEIMILARNTAALKVLRSELENGKKTIGILYGTHHMPNLEKRLQKEMGFERGDAEWRTAWDLRGPVRDYDAIKALVGKDVMPKFFAYGVEGLYRTRELRFLTPPFPVHVYGIKDGWLDIGQDRVLRPESVLPMKEAKAYYDILINKKTNKENLPAWHERRAAVLASSEIKDYEESIKDYRKVIELVGPESVDTGIWANIGNVYSAKGDFAEAIENYDIAITRYDEQRNSSTASAEVVAEALRGWRDCCFKRGQADHKLKQYESSIKYYTFIIDEDQRANLIAPGVLYERASAYYSFGRYIEAISDLDTLIMHDLNAQLSKVATDGYKINEQNFILRGSCYYFQKNYDEAIRDFSTAIDYLRDFAVDHGKKENATAYYYRGHAWNEKREYEKALADYESVMRTNPEFARGWNAAAWILATCPDPVHRNGPKAVKYATKACELTKWKDGGTLDTLAAAHAESGDFDAAVEAQEKAIALSSAENKTEFEDRAKLFRNKKPYRSSPPAP